MDPLSLVKSRRFVALWMASGHTRHGASGLLRVALLSVTVNRYLAVPLARVHALLLVSSLSRVRRAAQAMDSGSTLSGLRGLEHADRSRGHAALTVAHLSVVVIARQL